LKMTSPERSLLEELRADNARLLDLAECAQIELHRDRMKHDETLKTLRDRQAQDLDVMMAQHLEAQRILSSTHERQLAALQEDMNKATVQHQTAMQHQIALHERALAAARDDTMAAVAVAEARAAEELVALKFKYAQASSPSNAAARALGVDLQTLRAALEEASHARAAATVREAALKDEVTAARTEIAALQENQARAQTQWSESLKAEGRRMEDLSEKWSERLNAELNLVREIHAVETLALNTTITELKAQVQQSVYRAQLSESEAATARFHAMHVDQMRRELRDVRHKLEEQVRLAAIEGTTQH
jgi:hypothetical protein